MVISRERPLRPQSLPDRHLKLPQTPRQKYRLGNKAKNRRKDILRRFLLDWMILLHNKWILRYSMEFFKITPLGLLRPEAFAKTAKKDGTLVTPSAIIRAAVLETTK